MARDEIPEGRNSASAGRTDRSEGNSPDGPAAHIRAGDAAAFEAVFRKYFNSLAAFAFRYVRSRDGAADVVQEVFLNIWRNRATWITSGSIKAYLFESVRNRSIDALKREAVAERWAEQVSARWGVDVLHTKSPEADLETSDLAEALEKALRTFPERRRQVFLLRFKEGLSYLEIAQVMGTTTKTVENQINRALRSLREQLAPFAP